MKRNNGSLLYMVEPVNGLYKWECPTCGDLCEDPQGRKETCCHEGHIVSLAVVGTVHDGYKMVAKAKGKIISDA